MLTDIEKCDELTDEDFNSEPFHNTNGECCSGHGMTFIEAAEAYIRARPEISDHCINTDCNLPTIKTTGLCSASSNPKISFPAWPGTGNVQNLDVDWARF